MACGCNKRKPRRSQAIRISGTGGGNQVRAASNRVVNAQQLNIASTKPGKDFNTNGIDAEKRRIQAQRRNEILKKLGKK